MPSGVIRLRQAHKSLKSLPSIHVAQGATHHVTMDIDVGSGLAPTKSRPFASTRGEFPYTGTPISAEEPVRGEHRKGHKHSDAPKE